MDLYDLEEHLRNAISNAFKSCFEVELDFNEVQLLPTRKEFEGSHTFVTFPYLKVSGSNPIDTGNALGTHVMENSELITGFNVVKGFLNFVVSDNCWTQMLNNILADKDFGSGSKNDQKVMVEFSSPNTNKPLHLGHLRNNFLGDSVARILSKAGYEVMRTNLVNDRGIHICKSMLAYAKYGNNETPEQAGLKGDHLVGKYYVLFDQHYKREIQQLVNEGQSEEEAKKKAPLMLEAQALLKKWEEKDAEVVDLWSKLNGWVYSGFDKTYHSMGIEFDKIYSESDTYLLGKDIIHEGLDKGVFFRKEDHSVWIDLSDDGLDEKLVLRADGTSVYITQDLGTADFKYEDFPMDKSVYVVGNEQDYHFKVLFSILKKLGRSYGEGLYHLSYGMVDLPSGKMKSREGTVVDADDLIKEMIDTAERQTRELGKIEGLSDKESKELFETLGLGALKYFLLKVDPKKKMLFDPAESIEFQGHTGPFIQYTHARISAILRRADQLGISAVVSENLDLLSSEVEIIKNLSSFPAIVQSAAKDYSPALISQYVYDLAKSYNAFYQELPIFGNENTSQMEMRLALSLCTGMVIKQAMDLLGISVPERM